LVGDEKVPMKVFEDHSMCWMIKTAAPNKEEETGPLL
jgi:hypothetical protein